MNNLRQIKVTDFPRLAQFRTVRGLLGNQTEVFTAVSVFDNHLARLGILTGDILIVKITRHFNESNLYVWRTPHGQMARYGRETLAEITLHNGKGLSETFFRSEVEMLGVVVRVERDLKVKR